MSERYPGASESHHETSHESKANHERIVPAEASRSPEKVEHKHLKNIEHIRRSAHEQALKSETVHVAGDEKAHKPTEAYVNRELKELSYNRLLNRARKSLSPPARLASRVIHQPVINATSEVMAKTVARPSGIFGGGLLALTGTLLYYFITKHYGYSYNHFVFLLLLVAGFAVGWISEILWRLSRPSKT
jgi:hypothetical protein